jgi:uncharacterized membrane protein
MATAALGDILRAARESSKFAWSTHPRRFLSADDIQAVESAVGRAEEASSGQIKVVLARHCWFGLRRKARRLFGRFGLDQTVRRNCVMILLVTSNRQFLIYGDRGIHEHVGREFWNAVRDAIQAQFRTGDLAGGLCAGIAEIGRRLAEHFPKEGGGDELPNRIDLVP